MKLRVMVVTVGVIVSVLATLAFIGDGSRDGADAGPAGGDIGDVVLLAPPLLERRIVTAAVIDFGSAVPAAVKRIGAFSDSTDLADTGRNGGTGSIQGNARGNAGGPRGQSGNQDGNPLRITVAGAADGVGDALNRAADGVGDAVGEVAQGVGDAADEVGKAVGGPAGGAVGDAGSAAEGAGAAADDAADDVGDAVEGAADDAGDAAASAVDAVGDAAGGEGEGPLP
jgi:hypothetical protein